MANRWGNNGNSDRLYFLGLQNCYKWWLYEMVTMKLKEACSLEEKQWQILTAYWKAELTLLTKVCIVKAMVFPVVMYGCESWTIKKAECWRTDVFELWCWRRLLRAPWTARRSNQSILKEINPEYSLEGLILKLKLQYFGYLMWRASSVEKTDAGRDWRQKEKGQQRMRW